MTNWTHLAGAGWWLFFAPVKGLVASTKTTVQISRFQREQWNEDALKNHTLRVANWIFSSNIPNILQELTRTKETSYSNMNISFFFKEQVRVYKHQHLLHLCHLNISPGPKFYHFKDDMYGCSTRRCTVDLGQNGTTQKTEMPMEVAWKLLVGGFNPSPNGFIFPKFRGENKTYLSCHQLD